MLWSSPRDNKFEVSVRTDFLLLEDAWWTHRLLSTVSVDSRDSLRCSISRRWMKDAITVRDPKRKFTNLLIPMFDRLHFFGLMRVAVVKVWPMRVSVNDWLVRVPMCVASGGW